VTDCGALSLWPRVDGCLSNPYAKFQRDSRLAPSRITIRHENRNRGQSPEQTQPEGVASVTVEVFRVMRMVSHPCMTGLWASPFCLFGRIESIGVACRHVSLAFSRILVTDGNSGKAEVVAEDNSAVINYAQSAGKSAHDRGIVSESVSHCRFRGTWRFSSISRGYCPIQERAAR